MSPDEELEVRKLKIQAELLRIEARLAELERQEPHQESQSLPSPAEAQSVSESLLASESQSSEPAVDADGVLRNIKAPVEVGSNAKWRAAKSKLETIQRKQQQALDKLWRVNRRRPRFLWG